MQSLIRLFAAVVVTLPLFAFYTLAADIVDVEGEKAANVGSKDTVRITGKGIAGAKIDVKVEGAGKLDATNNVRKIKDGQTVIGAEIKEFIITPTMTGEINVTVTVKNPTSNTPIVTKYKIVVK